MDEGVVIPVAEYDQLKQSKLENNQLWVENKELKLENNQLGLENDNLRGLLAKGKGNCVYCELPADDIAKCKSGFPGCARMDDIINALPAQITQNELDTDTYRLGLESIIEAVLSPDQVVYSLFKIMHIAKATLGDPDSLAHLKILHTREKQDREGLEGLEQREELEGLDPEA